ncbi:hypothetical protein [Reinekea sp.]|jgi:ribosome maturation factor RimP|uniref:hypothetical protein n=1 Tax=Reinekea sp. TaxID=1970455 RepID=UPI003989090A
MLNDLNGKDVTITLSATAWGNFDIAGKIIEVSEDWVKLQGKKKIELIATSAIKKISYKL